MKIALVRQRYTPFGGAERFVERALGALRQEGVEVTLITRSWEGAAQEGFRQLICNPPYSRLLGGRAARDRSFAACAQQALANGGYDITQAHERIPGCMIFRAGDGVHAAWLDHRGRTQSAIGRWLARHSPFHRFILQQEARMLADPALRAVICNSALVQEEMRRYYGVADEKLVLIENGIDLQQFSPGLRAVWRDRQRQALEIDDRTPVFLFVGNGFERKGAFRLLEAFATLSPSCARLFIVGADRQAAHLQRRIETHSLGGRVTLVGAQQDVKPWYGMADAFVLPTLYDPMPNAALEALACGLPVITSTGCGIAARLRHDENGFVCDALDIPALAQHLATLCVPGKAESMRDAARASVTDLSLEAMAGQLTALYRRLHAFA